MYFHRYINFQKNVTSITMRKQAKAFQNVTKLGSIRNTSEDRILCKEHYEQYIRDCKDTDTVEEYCILVGLRIGTRYHSPVSRTVLWKLSKEKS